MVPNSIAYLACCLVGLLVVHRAVGIGCFVCSSVNGSEPDCEDTFNNTNKFYIPSCYAGRRERMGLFPATECIKMTAKLADNGYTVLVRTCVVDNGETNTETEIGRESHCWFINKIKYEDQYMRGCVLACNTDGCNGAPPNGKRSTYMIAITLGALIWQLVMSDAKWLPWLL